MNLEAELLVRANVTNLFISLGLSIGKNEDKLGIRASSTCDIILDNTPVTKNNLLGEEGQGFKIAMSGLGELFLYRFSILTTSINLYPMMEAKPKLEISSRMLLIKTKKVS